ncbi:hypothetical protein [Streptomyces sioyaensis]|uniref:hypothetical protein n=1 Tax=Streptomyces sioyaensis TaxID=67364 RepID=UPI0037A8C992
MSGKTKEQKCRTCHKVKALEDFPLRKDAKSGHDSQCKECLAADTRRRRAGLSLEERAEEARAFRAGMRKDKCAICGTRIQGQGICVTCEECVEVLGGLDGLKKAVRAVRYLTGKE